MSVQLWEAAEGAERERAEACAALAQSRRWHREALDDYLRVLADRADGKAPLRIRVALEPDNLMPAFGCYLQGSATEGCAEVRLNFVAHVVSGAQFGDSAGDVRRSLAESLAHELFHAAQELLGQALREDEIQAALAEVHRRVADGEAKFPALPESTEQAIQQMTRDLMAAEAEADRLRPVVEALLAERRACEEMHAAKPSGPGFVAAGRAWHEAKAVLEKTVKGYEEGRNT